MQTLYFGKIAKTINIDEDMGIRYNDDIDIPYRKKNNLMNMLYRQTTEQIN